MDFNNLHHNDPNEDSMDAFERAARQQAAMQEEQEVLREQSAQPVNETPVSEAPAAEPRTPYQVPVRDSAAPRAQEQPESRQAIPNVEPEQPRQRPTYEQWSAQENARHAKKRRVSGRRIALCAGGVAAALLLFIGGAAAGSLIGNLDFKTDPDTSATTSNLEKTPSAITISESPKLSGDLGDYGLPGDVIYERVDPSVVSITATSLTSNGGSLGSGIVMTADGYIITNNHVIEDMDKFTVTLSDGSELNASLVAGDADTDVAVLKAETNGRELTVPEFGDSDALKPGETCYAIGTPTAYRLTNSITTGSISAINRNITINDKVMTLIQTDAAINSGNSGGALVNKYGQVVGITNAKLSSNVFSSSASYEGLGFAIPINTAKEVIDELMTNGYVAGRPSIGISGSEISEATAQYNEVPQGVLIQSIDSRAKAYSQGLQIRDIITGINGKTITTMDEINEVKNQFKAGDTVTLTVYRMSTGESLDIDITLTDAHDLEGADPAKVKVDESTNSEDSSSGSRGGYYSFPFGSYFGW